MPLDPEDKAEAELAALFALPERVVYVASDEEDAIRPRLNHIATSALGSGAAVKTWDLASPLAPGQLLDELATVTKPVLVVIKDTEPFRDGVVARKLRSLGDRLGDRPVRILLLGREPRLPGALGVEIPALRWPQPGLATLEELVMAELLRAGRPTDQAAMVARALTGLGRRQARAALGQMLGDESPVDALFCDKLSRVDAMGLLEHQTMHATLDEVGGMAFLKEWAAKRGKLFATGQGPRGLLLVGVPGCGKSYVAKALARTWSLPLFRLDMARVFAGTSFGPEGTFVRALDAIARLAPAALWIDELETAFASGSLDAAQSSRVYAAFLTWLQDRPPGIFVAATANRIEMLPPELLRKGRFDQLFFVDLPDEDERKDIFRIHLKRAAAGASFDLIVLAKSTPGWSGAEIEALVNEAWSESQINATALDQAALLRAASRAVPLSVTLDEPIKKLREWAHRRALHASRGRF